jgi:scyllo-inositol 2-dehydrogenase (NADP+)
MYKRIFLLLTLVLLATSHIIAQKDSSRPRPLRIGVVGLVHDHVRGLLGRANGADFEIVGIAESNRGLAEKYSKQYGYNMNLVYATMNEMIEKTKPDAVLAFSTIKDHLKVVEYCAPRGIHVMVEKPLAVSAEDAGKMIGLAKKYNIHLLTNYETTWYGSNELAYQFVENDQLVGDIRKIVFNTGHPGPVEIGCSPEFLEWLTDPVLNGAGALTDFGCYGANLATWFMKGEKPISVTAVAQHIKPELYPKVEDEATIILTYKKAQVIIEASWNWPYGRKDMELYGQTGFVICKDGTKMLVRGKDKKETDSISAPALPAGRNDPFLYFANVIRGDIRMATFDLSAEANNDIVVKILEAAKVSVKTGKTVIWNQYYHD